MNKDKAKHPAMLTIIAIVNLICIIGWSIFIAIGTKPLPFNDKVKAFVMIFIFTCFLFVLNIFMMHGIDISEWSLLFRIIFCVIAIFCFFRSVSIASPVCISKLENQMVNTTAEVESLINELESQEE